MVRSPLFGAAMASLAALLWGSWFPLSRVLVRDAMLSAEDIGILRYSVAGVCLLPVVLRHGLKAGRAGWLGTAVMTVGVGFPFTVLITTGLRYAPAAHGALFVPGVFPALTVLLGIVVLRDRPTWRGLGGTLLVVLGVGGVGWNALTGGGGGGWQGYALFGVCAWLWAAYSIAARVAGITALHGVAIISVLSLVLCVPLSLVLGDVRLHQLPPAALMFQLLYQGIGIGLVALIAYNHAINVLGAAQAAIFGGLVPCVAALLAVPIAGERLGPAEIAGIAAVTAGILLVTGARLPRLRRQPAVK